jgi:hypothetical protein
MKSRKIFSNRLLEPSGEFLDATKFGCRDGSHIFEHDLYSSLFCEHNPISDACTTVQIAAQNIQADEAQLPETNSELVYCSNDEIR